MKRRIFRQKLKAFDRCYPFLEVVIYDDIRDPLSTKSIPLSNDFSRR
ncbi:MAG: hypothetical protein H7Y07_17620 [Pyrinomonadaceae bacterium]|nr:hypothetical protein [Sphingobacteriaceae bacterium]